MKKFSIGTLALVLMVLVSLSQAQAFCLVRNSTDPANVHANIWTLRYAAQVQLPAGTCETTANSGSYDFGLGFTQSIRFQTIEWGCFTFDGAQSCIDINKIVLSENKPLVLNSSEKTVIGNFSKSLPADSSYAYDYPDWFDKAGKEGKLPSAQNPGKDYGSVIIDAKTNFDEEKHPFTCAPNTKEVILRSLVIYTNKIDKDKLFKDASCLRDGGDVYVCGEFVVDGKKPGEEGWCIKKAEVPGTEEICDNGQDDNDNNLVDCDDDACSEAANCKETPEPTPEVCFDEVDQDGDGAKDCDDADCANDPDFDDVCRDVVGDTEVDCNDQIDNDENGTTDCDDPACVNDPVCNENPVSEICDDEQEADEDGDTLANCADPDCQTDFVACPTETEILCEDAADNDNDGTVDCDDSDCADAPACTPPPTNETNCGDGQDEDNDGFADCDDPDCEGSASCAVENTDLDGDGYATNQGDCNDNDPSINPGVNEKCDGVDNDCDQKTDETCSGKVEDDNDEDGFCESTTACSGDAKPGDCDDTNPEINPNAIEICDDQIDNNCDGKDVTAAEAGIGDGTPASVIKAQTGGEVDAPACEITPVPKGSGSSGGGCGCDLSGTHSFKATRTLPLMLLALIPFMGLAWVRVRRAF